MTKTQELLSAGKITAHETQADTYWAYIPLKLTAAQIDNGLVEMVAINAKEMLRLPLSATSELRNWSAVDIQTDEEGNVTETPKDVVDAVDHVINFFQDLVKYGAQELLRRSANKQAREAAQAQVTAQLQALGL